MSCNSFGNSTTCTECLTCWLSSSGPSYCYNSADETGNIALKEINPAQVFLDIANCVNCLAGTYWLGSWTQFWLRTQPTICISRLAPAQEEWQAALSRLKLVVLWLQFKSFFFSFPDSTGSKMDFRHELEIIAFRGWCGFIVFLHTFRGDLPQSASVWSYVD